MTYGVIFDVDGTLFDTSEGICDCTRYALSCVGAPPIPLELQRKFIGPSLYDGFTQNTHLDHDTALKAVEHYRERYRTIGIDMTVPYDGVAEQLAALHREGFVLTVASNKPLTMVEYLLKKYDWRRYFAAVYAPDFATLGSDKSDLVRLAASAAERNVMIGDTKFDIAGAHAAGVKVIAVTYGFGVEGTLGDADWIADTPAAAAEIVRNEKENF